MTSINNDKKIIVLGAGAFGTSLSIALDRVSKGNVYLLPKFESERKSLIDGHNDDWLPEIKLPKTVNIGSCYDDLESNLEIFNTAKAIFWVIPTKFSMEAIKNLKSIIRKDCTIVICSKGFFVDDSKGEIKLISQIIEKELTTNFCVLSGPNFAKEIALNRHTASVIASKNIELARGIAELVQSKNFKIFVSNDYISAQISGAIKNVIAIACGIVSGAKLGPNARAAIVSMGLQDIRKISIAYGGHSNSMMSLSCLGDCILTCFSEQSRNTSFGIKIGQGEQLESILLTQKKTVEGYFTAKYAFEIAKSLNIETTVLTAIYNILYRNEEPIKQITQILESNNAITIEEFD